MVRAQQVDAVFHEEDAQQLVTGEAVALDLRPASFVLRAAGAVIDYVVYFGTYIGLTLLFIYYALQLRQEEIYAAQTGGAQPHIQPKDLTPILIKIPEDVKEQAAIASVLSDMDAEITELEARRDKTRNIKQAMMQELLTGKTRLV